MVAAIVLATASIAWQLDAPAVAVRLFQSNAGLHGSLHLNGDHASLTTAPGTCGASAAAPSCSTP